MATIPESVQKKSKKLSDLGFNFGASGFLICVVFVIIGAIFGPGWHDRFAIQHKGLNLISSPLVLIIPAVIGISLMIVGGVFFHLSNKVTVDAFKNNKEKEK